MNSFKKDTHRYSFGLVKAANEISVDIAEKLSRLMEMRIDYQAEAIKITINKSLIKPRL